MRRRTFLTSLAGAVAGAVTTAGCEVAGGASGGGTGSLTSSTPASPTPAPPASPTVPAAPARFPIPGGAISVLPGDEPTLLLGVDDGVSAEAITDYCRLAVDADLHLVFFGNGCYDSWRQVAPTLRPLVDSGRVQLANHTVNHPKLTTIADGHVASELTENAAIFRNLYGVDLAPWFRPPYGLHDDRVDRIAADLGYHPPVLWSDTFADWNPTSTAYYQQQADRCFQPRTVVLAHANKPDVAPAYPHFVDVIRSRGLRTVTLDDVFQRTPAH